KASYPARMEEVTRPLRVALRWSRAGCLLGLLARASLGAAPALAEDVLVPEGEPIADATRIGVDAAGPVSAVAFSPDGRHLATGAADRSARVWDVDSGDELRELAGHGAAVSAVAFSPDGRRLATGSMDRTARLWDAGTGAELRRLTGHGESVFAIAFSPDG